MILPIEHLSAVARGNIYHLKITLDDVEPPIWRRLQVPGDATLGWEFHDFVADDVGKLEEELSSPGQ